MTQPRVQINGLCRFSFPANLDAFQTRHDDMAARRAALYAADRLATRFFLFETFLLPAIKAQTDPDFSLIILMGDDFPDPWRSRMLDQIADCPQIRPVFSETGNHRDVYRDLLRTARDPKAEMIAEFRLDDDDAVAIDYIAQIRQHSPLIAALIADQGRATLDFQAGLVVDLTSGQISYRPVKALYWAAGMTVFLRPGAPRCAMDFPHFKTWQMMPTLAFEHQPMFLRGIHGTNDSAVELRGTGTYPIADGGAEKILRDRFAVDPDAAARAFAALSN